MTGTAVTRRQPQNGAAATLGTSVEKLDPFAVGKVLAASGFFPDARQEAQAVAKVIAGMELGFGPMAAMTGVHIIEGKPSLAANLLATCVKRHPNYDYRVRQHTDDGCSIEFFQEGESIGTSEFTIADAQRAGIANKGNFKRYPKAMMFARALSQGVRWYCPDVTAGAPAYVPEELGAEVDGEGEPVEVVQPAAASPETPVDEREQNVGEDAQEPGEAIDADTVATIGKGMAATGYGFERLCNTLGSLGVDAPPINRGDSIAKAVRGLSAEQGAELLADIERFAAESEAS